METSATVWPSSWYRLGGGDGDCVFNKPNLWKNKIAIIVWLEDGESDSGDS